VPDALEAPDLDLALDVLLHVAAQVTLDPQVLVDVGTDPRATSSSVSAETLVSDRGRGRRTASAPSGRPMPKM
jgi:hypothetical protein